MLERIHKALRDERIDEMCYIISLHRQVQCVRPALDGSDEKIYIMKSTYAVL